MQGSRRFAAALAAALTSVALGGTPALADAPTNDISTGAETIATVPFSITQDTSEATTDADDAELNAFCASPATDASVWYTITPSVEQTLLADVRESSYSAAIFVATGSPGGFELVTCGPGTALWDVTPDQTYYLLVVDDQTDSDGLDGGQMKLTLDVAPPPPVLEVTVNDTARFDAKTGSVFLSGTIMCGSDALEAFLETQVTQRAGRMLIRGYAGTVVTCDGTARPFELAMEGENGLFKGGNATASMAGYACGEFTCTGYEAEYAIRITGRN
jgi:hypothetical protein